MRLGLAGPSHVGYSITADSQRTVNLFPELVPGGRGKAPVVLTGVPGIAERVEIAGSSGVKALFYDTATRRTFAVVRLNGGSSRLYELTTNQDLGDTATDRGELLSSNATMLPTSISSNGLELMIVCPEEKKAFLFTFSSNALAEITSEIGSGEPVWGAYLDGYFIALGSDGKFYLSGIKDGATWDGTDVATAESNPDTATMILADRGYLWIFGPESVEIWRNTGDPDFPFAPLKLQTIQMGLLYTYSVVRMNGAVYFVARSEEGEGIVVEAKGPQVKVVSNYAVANSLQKKTVSGTAPVGWAHQHMGHYFYVLTFPDDNLTWGFDPQLGPDNGWHERMFLNAGVEEAHRGRCCELAGGEDGAASAHLVGDRESGKIYVMSQALYDDDGMTRRHIRRAQHISDELKQTTFHNLKLDVEQGVGECDYSLRYSDDGGKLFGKPVAITANSGPAVEEAIGVEIDSGGAGYDVGDILTVAGGTGDAVELIVKAVDGAGAVTGVDVFSYGAYSDPPGNDVSVSGGAGAGATFDLELQGLSQDYNPEWTQLGTGEDRVFEVYADTIGRKHVWIDAYLNISPGIH